MQFSIGCDPEIFLVDKHGKFKSAIGLIGGSKWVPRPIPELGEGHAMLEDNVAVEFNIAPATDHTQFLQSIRNVMATIQQTVGHELQFSDVSAVSFDQQELMHPQALEFGCEPDFNAWTKEINPRPLATDMNLRSCGGHVHVGFTGLDRIDVVRAMDVFLGAPSTLLDNDTKRRQLYGKAGCHRPKPYGVEYRTLSNFWIFKDELVKWVYDQTAKAVEFVAKGNTIDQESGELVQRCINLGDQDAYTELSKRFAL